MKLRDVPLHDIIEAPRAHRVREVDDSFVKALAESFRSGSDQQSPIPVYEGGGKYHALGGNHQLAAMKSAFGEDSDRTVVVRILVPRKQEDAILEAAKDNNHRDMTMLEWQAIFALAKARLGTQKAVATFFGVSESFVSKCEHMDSYGPEAQSRRRAGSKNGMITDSPQTYTVAPSPQDGQPVPSDLSTPPNGSMTPETAQGETPSVASSSKDAPGGDPGPSKSASHPSPSFAHADPESPSFLAPPTPRTPEELASARAYEALQALSDVRTLLSPRRYGGGSTDALTALAREMEAVAWGLLDTAADIRRLNFPITPTPREHIPVPRPEGREVRARRAIPDNGGSLFHKVDAKRGA